MAGNNNRGRPRVDDPKINVPNYVLKQSTIIEIETIAEKLNIKRSELLQQVVENGLNIIKNLLKS